MLQTSTSPQGATLASRKLPGGCPSLQALRRWALWLRRGLVSQASLLLCDQFLSKAKSSKSCVRLITDSQFTAKLDTSISAGIHVDKTAHTDIPSWGSRVPLWGLMSLVILSASLWCMRHHVTHL